MNNKNIFYPLILFEKHVFVLCTHPCLVPRKYRKNLAELTHWRLCSVTSW